MRVISNKRLKDFAAEHPVADGPLQDWRRIIEASTFKNFSDIRKTFRTVDIYEKLFIFDIGGNKFRIIASIHFNTQLLYVREVFTHLEYDKWNKQR